MKKHRQLVMVIPLLALAILACSYSFAFGTDTPSSTPSGKATENPDRTNDLLPHTLLYLGRDNMGVIQVFRMARDGKTVTQLTSEPTDVTEYDASPADGSIAYVVNNQLVYANGSVRRVLVDGGTVDPNNQFINRLSSPVFSIDGQTLAYGYNGLQMYSFTTEKSELLIKNQLGDVGNGIFLPKELYFPERYSPDGTKLLVALGHWEQMPSHAVYYPGTNTLVRYKEVKDYIYCCSFHGGPVWSPDSSSFYGVASAHDFAYKSGEIWKIDATNGDVTRVLRQEAATSFNLPEEFNLPKELYLAPDGQLYFFFGSYTEASGLFDAPVLEMVRSASDGVTNRTVLRNENFVLMNEALWAPDASFVIVAMALDRSANQGGSLGLYPTDGQQSMVQLAPFGQHMKWGP